MAPKIILHAAGRVVTVHPHNRSSSGLNVFLHRATTTRDAIPISERGNAALLAQVNTMLRLKGEPELSKSTPRAKVEATYRQLSGDSAGALIGGGHRPEGKHARRTPIDDVMNGPNSGQLHNDNPAQLRATGRTLVQYCNTTNEVRQWARDEHYTRAQEAFLVEGFKQQRKIDGLSENV